MIILKEIGAGALGLWLYAFIGVVTCALVNRLWPLTATDDKWRGLGEAAGIFWFLAIPSILLTVFAIRAWWLCWQCWAPIYAFIAGKEYE